MWRFWEKDLPGSRSASDEWPVCENKAANRSRTRIIYEVLKKTEAAVTTKKNLLLSRLLCSDRKMTAGAVSLAAFATFCSCWSKQCEIFGRLSFGWNFSAKDSINTGGQKTWQNSIKLETSCSLTVAESFPLNGADNIWIKTFKFIPQTEKTNGIKLWIQTQVLVIRVITFYLCLSLKFTCMRIQWCMEHVASLNPNLLYF